MKVYFVRHGESTFNALGLHQHSHVSLSEAGKKQADFVAKRFEKIPVDFIIASPFVRARQTAEIINAVVKKEIAYSELLAEIKRPTVVERKSVTDPSALEVKDAILTHYHEEAWHHSDEENFYDLHKRALLFITHIEGLPQESILVVTHGIILKMIIASMFFKKRLTSNAFLSFEGFFRTKNAGITVCEKENGSGWRLLAWNDSSHLG